MTERIVTDPSQHGWVEVNGKWMWGASGGSGGSIADGDTEGQITTWDGTEWTPEGAVVVDAGGNVGIGALPVGLAQLQVTPPSGPAAFKLTSDASEKSFIQFSHSGNVFGNIAYDNADNSMSFSTNLAEHMRIDPDGNVHITGKLFVNGVEVGGGGGGLWTDNGDGTISYSGTAKATDFVIS